MGEQNLLNVTKTFIDHIYIWNQGFGAETDFSENFPTFPKSKKISLLYPKKFKITISIKIWPKFSAKLKNSQIILNTFIYQNFWRLRRRKFGNLCSLKPRIFWSWGPLGQESPPKRSLYEIVVEKLLCV